MTYHKLRTLLPSHSIVPALGGSKSFDLHNLVYGHLYAVNGFNRDYNISQGDWANARIIRSRNPKNPWLSRHYTELSEHFSYGLIYAAALLRYIEMGGITEIDPCDAGARNHEEAAVCFF